MNQTATQSTEYLPDPQDAHPHSRLGMVYARFKTAHLEAQAARDRLAALQAEAQAIDQRIGEATRETMTARELAELRAQRDLTLATIEKLTPKLVELEIVERTVGAYLSDAEGTYNVLRMIARRDLTFRGFVPGDVQRKLDTFLKER